MDRNLKGFMPKDFLEEKQNSKNKKDDFSLWLLIIIALLLSPKFIEGIKENKKEIITKEEKKDEYVSIDEILFWNNLDVEYSNGTVKNGDASLNIKGSKALISLSENNNFKISSVCNINEETFKVNLLKR